MGEVLPFIARMRASSDWTATERASLERLADQFADHSLGVEAVFGVTEEGDPWCVVKDADEEVLVHVARIDGRFVIHYAASDTIDEGVDLHDAIAERLGEVVRAPENVVVDGVFDRNRQAQILAALLIVTAFFYDTQDAHAAARETPPPQPTPEPEVTLVAAPAKSDAGSRQDRDSAAHGAALIDQAAAQAVMLTPAPQAETHVAAAVSAPQTNLPAAQPLEHAPAAAPATARVPLAQAQPQPTFNLIQGTSGDDHLVGTTGADHILGGDGADLLDGAGAQSGQFDVLDGGAGDDTLLVTAQTIAIGGAGADTFVLRLPTPAEAAAAAAAIEAANGPPPARPAEPQGEYHSGDQTFLGVIADFDSRQGDRLVNTRGETVQLRPHIEMAAPNGGSAFAATSATSSNAATAANANLMTVFGFTGHRVDVDLDNDGKVDGYVIMGGHLPPELIGGSPVTVHDVVVSLIGQRAQASNDDLAG